MAVFDEEPDEDDDHRRHVDNVLAAFEDEIRERGEMEILVEDEPVDRQVNGGEHDKPDNDRPPMIEIPRCHTVSISPFGEFARVDFDAIGTAEARDLAPRQDVVVWGVIQCLGDVPEVLFRDEPIVRPDARQVERTGIAPQGFETPVIEILMKIRHCQFPDVAVDRLAVAQNGVVGF